MEQEKKVTPDEARRESLKALIPKLCESGMIHSFIGALHSEEQLDSKEACDDSVKYLKTIKAVMKEIELPDLKPDDRKKLEKLIDAGVAACKKVKSGLNK